MTSNQNFPITFKVSRSSLSLSDEFFSSWQILKPPDETHSFGSEVGILRGLASILKDTKHTRGRMQYSTSKSRKPKVKENPEPNFYFTWKAKISISTPNFEEWVTWIEYYCGGSVPKGSVFPFIILDFFCPVIFWQIFSHTLNY